MPTLPLFQQILAEFLTEYWDFYQQLLVFKKATQDQQHQLKIAIEQDFETLFTRKTPYDDLNEWINHTFYYKK